MSKKLPKISIITPSYNQKSYIKETIKSVLSQNYPNLEYLVMDGGSTDGTADLLRAYKSKLNCFFQKDNGQTDAINKGLELATGDIVGYINSDDLYLAGTLSKISQFFIENPEIDWLTGKCIVINDKGNNIRSPITEWKNFWLKSCHAQKTRLRVLYILNYISQPATFWRKRVLGKIGKFDENLHFTMDYDYWLRLMNSCKFAFIDQDLAAFRIHKDSKGVKYTYSQFNEGYDVVKRYTSAAQYKLLHCLHDFLVVSLYSLINKI